MKTLYFCRHAKADWTTTLSDHDRPLNERGMNSIPVTAEIWKDYGDIPSLWVSSSAKRALRTAHIMAAEMSSEIVILVEPELYNADVKNWIKVINALPESASAVAIFGHNPGITDIINYLCESNIGSLSTCGLVKTTFDVDQWKLISGGSGTLEWKE